MVSGLLVIAAGLDFLLAAFGIRIPGLSPIEAVAFGLFLYVFSHIVPLAPPGRH